MSHAHDPIAIPHPWATVVGAFAWLIGTLTHFGHIWGLVRLDEFVRAMTAIGAFGGGVAALGGFALNLYDRARRAKTPTPKPPTEPPNRAARNKAA